MTFISIFLSALDSYILLAYILYFCHKIKEEAPGSAFPCKKFQDLGLKYRISLCIVCTFCPHFLGKSKGVHYTCVILEIPYDLFLCFVIICYIKFLVPYVQK